MAQADIVQLQEKKLQQQMRYLQQHSALYQQKFADAGLQFNDIKTLSDLTKIPFTVKQDLRDSLQAEPPFEVRPGFVLNLANKPVTA